MSLDLRTQQRNRFHFAPEHQTAEKHRQAVMDKLSLHDIAGLTRYAFSKGMLSNAAAPLSAPPN